jgi:hypothetical protein
VSHIRRLCVSDRIFVVTVNLRRQVRPVAASEYPLLIEALEGARRRLGFLLGKAHGRKKPDRGYPLYVLMPDRWHALIWTGYPLTISQAIHDVKKVSVRQLHHQRGTPGPVWQHQFWDRFVRHAPTYGALLYSNFALNKALLADCPIQIDYVILSEQYRA